MHLGQTNVHLTGLNFKARNAWAELGDAAVDMQIKKVDRGFTYLVGFINLPRKFVVGKTVHYKYRVFSADLKIKRSWDWEGLRPQNDSTSYIFNRALKGKYL